MRSLEEQMDSLEVLKDHTYLMALRGAHPSYMRVINKLLLDTRSLRGKKVVPINVTSEVCADYGDMKTIVFNPESENLSKDGKVHAVPTLEEEDLHKAFFDQPVVQAKLKEIQEKGASLIVRNLPK